MNTTTQHAWLDHHLPGSVASGLDALYQHLADAYGEEANAFLKAVDAESLPQLDPFAPPRRHRGLEKFRLKNASLELSLGVSSAWWGGYYRKLVDLLEEAPLGTPARILDLGCDNGLTTSLIARRYPEAQVVGVDVVPEAIDRAREFQATTGITNATFAVASLTDAQSLQELGPFDAVVGALVFNEVRRISEAAATFGPMFDEVPWTLEDAQRPGENKQLGEAATSVAVACTPGARLLSVERCAHPTVTLWWYEQLQKSGWATHWATPFAFEECGETHRMPALVAQLGEADVLDTGELVRATQGLSPAELTEALEAKARCRFVQAHTYDHVAARDVASALAGEMPLVRMEVTYHYQDDARALTELWHYKDLLLETQQTTLGHSQLRVEAAKRLKARIRDLKAEAHRLSENPSFSVDM